MRFAPCFCSSHSVHWQSAARLRRLLDAADRIQAARIADVRQALTNNLCQKRLIIAHVHVPARVCGQLRLAATLRGQETKGDHLALGQIQLGACVIIAKAVIRQPAVDRTVFSRLLSCRLRKYRPAPARPFPGGPPSWL